MSTYTIFDGCILACYILPIEDCLPQWKITITKDMIIHLVKWYFIILAHPGYKLSQMTIQPSYYYPDIKEILLISIVITVNVSKPQA